jgi:hypothetical protein
MIGDGKTLPPWGKLVGVDNFLSTLDKTKTYYHLSVSPSYSGWALQVLSQYHGLLGKMRVVVTNSKTSVSLPKMLENAHLDQPILIRPNMLAVQQSQVKKMAAENNAELLPYGFWTKPYCDGITEWYESIGDLIRPERIVVAAGSGATLAAIATAAYAKNTNVEIIGVCCSSISTVRKQLERANETRPVLVDAPAALEAPFPASAFWDQRAWRYCVESCDLSKRTLFWNLGA